MKNSAGRLFSLFLILYGFNISFSQTASVRFELTVPQDIISDSENVFLAGSFNSWNPQDSLYLMKKTDNNLYYLLVPLFDNHKYEYKYTLGNWNNVELTPEGEQTKNRVLISHDGLVTRDTIFRWNSVKAAKQENKAPVFTQEQMEKLSALKEKMTNNLEGKIKTIAEVFKKVNENILSENPDPGLRKMYHDQIITEVDSVLGTVADLLWQTVSILTPEQKKAMLEEIQNSDNPGAIFDWISKEQGE